MAFRSNVFEWLRADHYYPDGVLSVVAAEIPMLKRTLLCLTLLSILIYCNAHSAESEQSSAVLVVENLHSVLINAMDGGEQLGFRGRYDLIAPVISESFDFPTIARIVTASRWNDATETEQRTFLQVFTDLSIATYADNFATRNGERFETLSSEAKRGAVIVHTDLVKADGSKVPFKYLLKEYDGHWRIVSVIAQGVSDLSLKRAEYTEVISNDGFDALVATLRAKTQAFGGQ